MVQSAAQSADSLHHYMRYRLISVTITSLSLCCDRVNNMAKIVSEGVHVSPTDQDIIEGPCLIEKALCMLTAMDSGKPKTMLKLENALRPCVRVFPYLNPLDALRSANVMLKCPPPVLNVQYTKRHTYIASTYRLNSDFETRIQENAEDGCIYDVAVQKGDVERSILQDALTWVRESEKREGEKEDLLKEFFQVCQKRVDHSPLAVAKKLQSNGYLEIDGDTVSYSLPEFSATLSTLLKRHSGQSIKSSNFDMINYPPKNETDIKDTVYEWLIKGGEFGPCRENINVDVSGDGPEEYLMDILQLYSLSGIMKPNNLTELLNLIKPQSLTYVVPPRRVIQQTILNIKLNQRKTKSQGMIRYKTKTRKAELVIGIQPGESKMNRFIPLTPEGLLGIDAHICPNGKDYTIDSAPEWQRNKQTATALQANGFPTTLKQRLACLTRCCGAVIVPASEREKLEIILQVLEWVNSYHTHGASEPNCAKSFKLKTVISLQNQLISRCTLKLKRIAPSRIVRSLQSRGYVSINQEASPEITYHIPATKTPCWPKNAPNAPWQVQADDFRQTIKKCCSSYMEKAFPSHKTSRNSKMSGKRKELQHRMGGSQKKQKKSFYS